MNSLMFGISSIALILVLMKLDMEPDITTQVKLNTPAQTQEFIQQDWKVYTLYSDKDCESYCKSSQDTRCVSWHLENYNGKCYSVDLDYNQFK